MSITRFVKPEGLPAFLAHLSKDARVLAPVVKPADKRSVVFEPWKEGKEIHAGKGHRARQGRRAAPVRDPCQLPQGQGQGQSAETSSWNWTTPRRPRPTVVFAARPCDARGYVPLDRPYLKGPIADPYYKARREKLTVITLTCNSGCNTCFCHWVGGGPSSPEGSDILMTELSDGYILQGITPKGDALLEGSGLDDGADRFKEMEDVRKAAWATLVKAPNLKDAPAKVAAKFTDVDFWTRETDRCLSCGACTYFCPTCYCFNITDEGEATSEKGGRRLRTWDNCMSPLFTREASGSQHAYGKGPAHA